MHFLPVIPPKTTLVAQNKYILENDSLVFLLDLQGSGSSGLCADIFYSIHSVTNIWDPMAGVFDCGFARVAVKQSFIKASGKPEMDKAKRLESYLAFFGGQHEQNFEIDPKKFNARSITLVKSFNKRYKKDEK